MPRSFDAIVVGLGATGSVSLRALARRGWRVLGLERSSFPHERGSSHGRSQIIREACFEHPACVPFIRRARLLWEELEREAGRRLLLETGGLMVGEPGGMLVEGALRSAREHGLALEVLDAGEIRRRFPAFAPGDRMVGVWEPRAGVLFPERCIAAALATARLYGAVVREHEPAVGWRREGAGVEVRTPRGRYRADRLVLAAGARLAPLVPGLELPLAVGRLVQLWFEPAGDRPAFAPERCPIAIWEHQAGRFFCSFPELEPGVKVALDHGGGITDAGRAQGGITDAGRAQGGITDAGRAQGGIADAGRAECEAGADEVRAARDLLRRHLPGADGPLLSSAACPCAGAPDGRFLVDSHPEHPQALLVSAGSRHGFQFAPAIGEIVSDLLVEGETRFDLDPFRLERPAHAPRTASPEP